MTEKKSLWGFLPMDRVRRDVVLVSLRQRQWRLALTVLFMPNGYSLLKEVPDFRTPGDDFGA